MQVKIKQEPRVFKPVTLEITFDTEDELSDFSTMMSYNLSLPSYVFPEEEVKREHLQYIVGKIHDQLHELIEIGD